MARANPDGNAQKTEKAHAAGSAARAFMGRTGDHISRGRFKRVERVSAVDSAAAMRGLLHTGQGPIFIHAKVEADDQKRIIPSRDGTAIKQRFMQASMKQV